MLYQHLACLFSTTTIPLHCLLNFTNLYIWNIVFACALLKGVTLIDSWWNIAATYTSASQVYFKTLIKDDDWVRIKKTKQSFEKGYSSFSQSIYQLAEVVPSKSITYKLKQETGGEILRIFYKEELWPIILNKLSSCS